MKKIRKYIYLLLIFSYVSFTSCEDFALGEKFLQKPPSGDVTIDTIFSTAEYARRVLWYAYSKLPYGFSTGYNNSTSMRVGSIIMPEVKTNQVERIMQLNTICTHVILGKGFAMHGSLLIMWTEYRI